MIHEVKVVTTGFAPEFGQTMGMVFNAMTPSVVHAGIHPKWSDLEAIAEHLAALRRTTDWASNEELAFATRVRCCDATGRRVRHTGSPAGCPPGFAAWDTHYGGDAFIVHGHWAARGFDRGARAMNLDSGCVYGGALTAWCGEEDRIVWVPSRTMA